MRRTEAAAPGPRPGPPALEYPLAPTPPIGDSLEVAPGVHWIRLPLPFRLDHINVWALRDGEGWTLVDTGLSDAATLGHWHALFAGLLEGRPVLRVIGTHLHPDHIGLAGWFERVFCAPLWMTRLEYLSARLQVQDAGQDFSREAVAFWRQAGWSRMAMEALRTRVERFGGYFHTLPGSFRRIADGDELAIGGRTWRVIVGTGHSPAHACLYCPALDLLISGDQILPRISSNVSVYPDEPEADPMSDWLDTLGRLREAVPPSALVLPAHNECFRGLHARIDALEDGQMRALDRLRAALDRPRRVVDLLEAIFRRPIPMDSSQVGLATGEAVACLNHLMRRGEVTRQLDGAAVAWYSLATR